MFPNVAIKIKKNYEILYKYIDRQFFIFILKILIVEKKLMSSSDNYVLIFGDNEFFLINFFLFLNLRKY